jgi:1-acyl-sn-glycerol-3-phosphate acyltransferase
VRVFRAVVACIKFPMFLILTSLSFFYDCLAFAVLIASLKKWIARVVFRILLLLCGVSHATAEVPPLQQTVLGAGDPAPIRGGDLIVANFGSHLDLFWLQSTYFPIFIIPAGSGLFSIHSIYSLFAAILTGSATSAGKRSPIGRAIQLARDVPLVVFPEGRPTNGGDL